MRKKKYTRHVGMLLTDEIYNKIVKITDRLEISVSQFIRETIEEKIKLIEGGEDV